MPSPAGWFRLDRRGMYTGRWLAVSLPEGKAEHSASLTSERFSVAGNTSKSLAVHEIKGGVPRSEIPTS